MTCEPYLLKFQFIYRFISDYPTSSSYDCTPGKYITVSVSLNSVNYEFKSLGMVVIEL